MPSPAVSVIEQIQSVLVDTDVVAALDDAELEQRMRERMAELAEPDFEVAMRGPGYAAANRTLEGPDGFREAWADWTTPFESFSITVDETIDAPDAVLSLVRQSGKTKTGGVEIETAAAAVWFVREGRLYRVEFHLDVEDARRAAGLDA